MCCFSSLYARLPPIIIFGVCIVDFLAAFCYSAHTITTRGTPRILSCANTSVYQVLGTISVPHGVINPGSSLGDLGERISFQKPHSIHGLPLVVMV